MLLTHGHNSSTGKWLVYAIYACVAIFPFTYYNSFLYWGTSTRSTLLILMVSILGIIGAVILCKKSTTVSIAKSPILLAIIIYGTSMIISGIVGLSFENTFWSAAPRTTGLWYLFHFALLILCLVHIFANKMHQGRLILTLIISTALYSFLAFLSPEGLGVLFIAFKSDGFTFGNSTFAGMYIFGGFLLSLYHLFNRRYESGGCTCYLWLFL